MSDLPGIVVTGASGRMGRMLIETIVNSDKARLTGAMERPGHDWIGQDLGTCLGGSAMGVIVSDTAKETLTGAQAVVDFTAPSATLDLARIAADTGTAHIIGTTGFTDADLAELAEIGKRNVIIRAGNMSLGVNLLTVLVKKVAEALDEDYDIEVVEAHHNRKVDAPSGTALMLGEAAADGRGVTLSDVADRGRDGITGARKKGDIGFAVIRGGGIVGEHDVIFAGPGERLTLRHVADDRSLFSKGALRAALWAQGKPAGEYSMLDVLGL